MCGIFAYLNHLVPVDRQHIIDVLLKGLERLEYRGYDSAGLAIDGEFNDKGELSTEIIKATGKVQKLREKCLLSKLDKKEEIHCHLGIAHTRWATHGEPSDVNSHPHPSNPQNTFAVVHNGIITNYSELKTFLQGKGHVFLSATDTEVISKLIQYHYDLDTKKQFGFRDIVEKAVVQLEGAFAIVVKGTPFPNEAVACRRGSPLLIGIKAQGKLSTNQLRVQTEAPLVGDLSDNIPVGLNVGLSTASTAVCMSTRDLPRSFSKSGRLSSMTNLNLVSEGYTAIEYFLASDASAIIDHTRRVIYLEDNDVAHIVLGEIAIHRVKVAGAVQKYQQSENDLRQIHTLEMEIQQLMRGNYDHFMMKEIMEQPEALTNAMRGRVKADPNNASETTVRLGGLVEYIETIRRSRRIMFIACGTSYHSCLAARAFLEEVTELPIDIELASDFMDRQCPIFRDDTCFFVSQSGETADTLNTLRYCKNRGALIVGIVNTVGSTISRESHCGVHLNIGPEIGVASTKAYTAQIVCLLMFGIMMGGDSLRMKNRMIEVIDTLKKLPELAKEVLKLNDQIKELAVELHQQKSLLVMGRGYQYATCLEGALKIKELTYMHSEGILSGELKHGPLALIDENMPVCMIVIKDSTFAKSINALQQVHARKGRPIVITTQECVESIKAFAHSIIVVPAATDCVQPILTTIPLQLLSYHIAVQRGYNVDFPRNLAKSVTVE